MFDGVEYCVDGSTYIFTFFFRPVCVIYISNSVVNHCGKPYAHTPPSCSSSIILVCPLMRSYNILYFCRRKCVIIISRTRTVMKTYPIVCTPACDYVFYCSSKFGKFIPRSLLILPIGRHASEMTCALIIQCVYKPRRGQGRIKTQRGPGADV